ncbi:MAG: preprotein translocase subunit SecG [Planctomycetota bacterium]|nr:preprotein translocase subunit SecG [Planctomycetota bacterium]
MNWLHYTLAAAIVFVCMLLVVIILLQKGRGGGLSGAFGGGGGSGSAFGAKTGDVFTWITVAFVCLYFLLNIAGNFQFRQVVAPPGLPATGPLATQPGADGAAGQDGDSAPATADEGQPGQPIGGEAVPLENQPPVSKGDDEAATPLDDQPAEGKGDD